jgi:hypothetical protein
MRIGLTVRFFCFALRVFDREEVIMFELNDNVRHYVAGILFAIVLQGSMVALVGLFLPIWLVAVTSSLFLFWFVKPEEQFEMPMQEDLDNGQALVKGFLIGVAMVCSFYILHSGFFLPALGVVLLLIFILSDSLGITGFEKKASIWQ